MEQPTLLGLAVQAQDPGPHSCSWLGRVTVLDRCQCSSSRLVRAPGFRQGGGPHITLLNTMHICPGLPLIKGCTSLAGASSQARHAEPSTKGTPSAAFRTATCVLAASCLPSAAAWEAAW